MSSHSKVQVQIAIRGRGADRLSHDACKALVLRVVDGNPIPRGLEVSIHLWRGNRELNWNDRDNPRSDGLREIIRRSVQGGFPFSIRSH